MCGFNFSFCDEASECASNLACILLRNQYSGHHSDGMFLWQPLVMSTSFVFISHGGILISIISNLL